MEHGKNQDLVILDDKEDAVRKACDQSATNDTVDSRKRRGCVKDSPEARLELIQKVSAEFGRACLISCRGLGKILLRLGEKDSATRQGVDVIG